MKHNFWSLQLFAEGISGEASAAAAGQQSTGESPARANTTQAAAANTTRLTWAQILADPEYNREMQKTVSARLKAAQQAWEKKAGAASWEKRMAGWVFFQIWRSMEVLPVPLAPTSATFSPAWTAKLTACSSVSSKDRA